MNGSTNQNEKLYGTWRLVSAVTIVVDTGETFKPYGDTPHGFITYGPEDRMQVIVVATPRPKPAHSSIDKLTNAETKELLQTLTAYAGTYSFDGASVTHEIDLSWNEIWTGTKQVRDVQIGDGRVTLTTRPAPSPRDGRTITTTLVWEKVKEDSAR